MHKPSSKPAASADPETPVPAAPVWRPARAIGLARALLKAGYGTRRETEDMVGQGRVRIGNRIVTDPRQMVAAGTEIFLDGELLRQLERRYYALHKPLRVVCGADTGGRSRTVREYFPENVPGLATAGRLDSMSSGLLLVSNDTGWNNMVTTTRGLEQEYRIQVAGELTDLEISVISAGVLLPGCGLFKPESVRIVECLNGHSVLNLAVREGKVRNLRRMLATLRHAVKVVRRIRIGEIRLANLAVGGYRELGAAEVAAIRRINAASRMPSSNQKP